jgi:hypothetical protein
VNRWEDVPVGVVGTADQSITRLLCGQKLWKRPGMNLHLHGNFLKQFDELKAVFVPPDEILAR